MCLGFGGKKVINTLLCIYRNVQLCCNVHTLVSDVLNAFCLMSELAALLCSHIRRVHDVETGCWDKLLP